MLKRPQTREEQDDFNLNTNTGSLRETNLKLKGKQFFDKSKKEKKPRFEKTFKPRELIKTSFYTSLKGKTEFQFNALLHEIPEEGEVFNDDNNNVFKVKNVTRNLITIKPGAKKETSIAVLVSQKDSR